MLILGANRPENRAWKAKLNSVHGLTLMCKISGDCPGSRTALFWRVQQLYFSITWVEGPRILATSIRSLFYFALTDIHKPGTLMHLLLSR